MPNEHHYATLVIDGKPCLVRGYCPWDPERKRVEAFIAARFQAAHGARVQHFMPLLIALETAEGELLALAGIRASHLEPLFLEHYLNAPIERVIASRTGTEASRASIVEVGNLAAVKPGYSRYLFAALTDLLNAWEFDWLACTGITSVLNIFHRLGMEPIPVAAALPEKIPGGGAGWGDYYLKHPQVMVGRVATGLALARRSGWLARMEYQRLENSHVLSA